MLEKFQDPPNQKKFGISKIIRELYKIPNWIPLDADIQHGWTAHDTIFQIANKNRLQLVWSKRVADILFSKGFKRYYQIPNQFISFTKSKFTRSNYSKGTLFFPQHTDEGWEAKYDLDILINVLKKLPEDCKPITICLYYYDYLNDKIKSRFERNFKVVTAGDISNPKFIEKFFNMMIDYDYCASDTIGTYTFYSVYMDIPFFLIDNHWGHISKESNQEGMNRDDYLKEFPEYKKAHDLFSVESPYIITDKQKEYVYKEMGLNNSNTFRRIQFELLLSGIKMLIKLQFKKILQKT